MQIVRSKLEGYFDDGQNDLNLGMTVGFSTKMTVYRKKNRLPEVEVRGNF